MKTWRKHLDILFLLFVILCLITIDISSTAPTSEPTIEPTVEPTVEVTIEPTSEPTIEPTEEPVVEPEVTTPSMITLPESNYTYEPTPISNTFELHQIYVGCADAYLIRTDDFTIMIDGGEKDSSSGGKNVRARVLNYLKDLGITHLDAYIVTHWHGDHAQNMYAILDKFGTEDTIVYGNSRTIPDEYSIPHGKGNYVQMLDGEIFTFGDIVIKCMGPYTLSGSENCKSLNFLVTFGDTKFFMTGDYVHKEVLDKYSDELKNVDVYKMAHHGLKVSNYSGNPDVLPHLQPDIILVPANSSGNTKTLLSNLGMSCQVYDGTGGQHVIVRSNGTQISVVTK